MSKSGRALPAAADRRLREVSGLAFHGLVESERQQLLSLLAAMRSNDAQAGVQWQQSSAAAAAAAAMAMGKSPDEICGRPTRHRGARTGQS